MEKLTFDHRELHSKIAVLEVDKRDMEVQMLETFRNHQLLQQVQQTREQHLPAAVDQSPAQQQGKEEEEDFQSKYEEGRGRISKLEMMLDDLKTDLRASSESHTEEIRALKEDIDFIK